MNAISSPANFTVRSCDVPLTTLFPYYNSTLLSTTPELDAELIWPCQYRHYWLTLQPFVNFVRFLLTYVTAFVVVTGVVMNGFSFAILSTPILNDSNLSTYLRALAVSDVGALVFIFATGIARSQWVAFNNLFMNSKFLCTLYSVTIELFQFTSTWLVVSLTWTRLYAVIFPLKERQMNGSATLASIIGLATISLAVSLTKLSFGGYENDSVFEFMPCNQTIKPYGSPMYVYTALSTWLPLIFIFLGNLLLIIYIRKAMKNQSRLVQSQISRIGLTFRSNRTFLAVSLVYLILLLPLGIVETVQLYWDIALVKHPSLNEQKQLLYIHWMKKKLLLKWCRGLCYHLYHWNFGMNFFLYYLTGKKFRVSALEILSNWLSRMKCKSLTTTTRASKLYLVNSTQTVNQISTTMT